MFLKKFNDKYEVCCRGNGCASAPPISLKARYVILKAYKKKEYVSLFYLLSLCGNIYTELLETQRSLALLWLACT